jgi:hypothetical protein
MTTGRINQVATFSPAVISCHPNNAEDNGQLNALQATINQRDAHRQTKNIVFGFTRPLGTVLSSYSAFADALNTKEAYPNIPLSNKDHESNAGSWLCTD